MLSAEDFEYAIENTKVVRPPERIIETFGTTSFRFVFVTELMDDAHRVRVRDGRIEAERPRIVAPGHLNRMLLDGFGEKAREFADWLEDHGQLVKILRYGFSLKKTDLSERIIPRGLDDALEMLDKEIRNTGDNTALVSGIDEAWELCLLKFTTDIIQRSSGENLDEWRRRGLI
jgi:hypothetical protein